VTDFSGAEQRAPVPTAAHHFPQPENARCGIRSARRRTAPPKKWGILESGSLKKNPHMQDLALRTFAEYVDVVGRNAPYALDRAGLLYQVQ